MKPLRLSCILLSAILLISLISLLGAKSQASKRPWTILLYGAVDNSADGPFVAFTDKVRRAIDDDPGIELVIFIDRNNRHAKRATFLGEDFTSTRLYRIKKDSVERLSGGAHFPELTKDNDVNLNSADASNLQRFIAWGKANFPAQHYQQFEAGKNGVFIVLPSGRPNTWKYYRWYTPIRGEGKNYGNWSFLKDGATPGNGAVENWFELLESWFNVPEEKRGIDAVKASEKELEKLQGEWTLVSMEQNGRKVKDEEVSRMKLTIKGDQWIVSLQGGSGWRDTIKIDPSQNPGTLDLTGPAGFTSPGIYKLEGDTLTLRHTIERGDIDRPREFKTTPEVGFLEVWKRAKN